MFHRIRSWLYASWLLVTFQDEVAPRHLKQTRKNLCYVCPIRDEQNNVCTACGCYIPIKVKLKNSSCPVGKW